MKNENGQVMFPPPGKTPREDTAAVMKFYKLPDAFPSQVRREAVMVSEALRKPGDRLDLRKKFIFTCDPATARDYDDALSLETDRRVEVLTVWTEELNLTALSAFGAFSALAGLLALTFWGLVGLY